MAEAAVEALDAAADRGQKLYVSPWTAWEVGMLSARGKLSLIVSPQQWFKRLLAAPLVALADLNADILIASSFLPADSLRDPADKIIAATAREYDYTLLTRDRLLLSYAEKGYLRAIPC